MEKSDKSLIVILVLSLLVVVLVGYIIYNDIRTEGFSSDRVSESSNDMYPSNELLILFESYCEEYNLVAVTSASHESIYNSEKAEVLECKEVLGELSKGSPADLLEGLLYLCRQRNFEIMRYDSFFQIKSPYKFEPKDCDEVIQAYSSLRFT
jgi:hypothetical protein